MRDRATVWQSADDPEQWYIQQPGREEVLGFRANEQQFQQLMDRLEACGETVTVYPAVA